MLAEYHITPEYVLENWTDEQFYAFCAARDVRISTIKEMRNPPEQREVKRKISDMELFAKMGISMQKQGNA